MVRHHNHKVVLNEWHDCIQKLIENNKLPNIIKPSLTEVVVNSQVQRYPVQVGNLELDRSNTVGESVIDEEDGED